MKAKTSAQRFEFVNKANQKAEVFLYGTIGESWFDEGISAKQFAKDLKALGSVKSIDLHIDSPGGSVTDARAIYTLLVEHSATVNVMIDGAAASAASYIAMAGDEVAIAEGGLFMIHEARGVARGTAKDFRSAATLMETINVTIADTYAARTKETRAKLLGWMADETWFTGKEAVAAGFADRIMPNKSVEACAYSMPFLNYYDKMPAHLKPAAVRRREILARMKGNR